jgi:hypothetical protein
MFIELHNDRFKMKLPHLQSNDPNVDLKWKSKPKKEHTPLDVCLMDLQA